MRIKKKIELFLLFTFLFSISPVNAIDINKEVLEYFSSLFDKTGSGKDVGIYSASRSVEKLIFNQNTKVIKGMDPKTFNYIYDNPPNTKWNMTDSNGIGEFILLMNKFDFIDAKKSKSDDKYAIKFQNFCEDKKSEKFKASTITKAKVTFYEGSFVLINAMVPKVTSKVKEKKSFEVSVSPDSDVTIDLNYKPTEGIYYVAKLEILAVSDPSLKKFCTDKFSIGKSE
ncbi:hypothetical protein LEP1GSC047_0944 [Leptospira inadai serovar Lyme str. 10]|uniref:Uncharacterized protein n=2 Tax=Leptospira inadai serovar Lyme TaxID=293084 RepID=V6HZ16_9LEPT|nr:hypothetical protein [Leptospira inadai]EQA38264.1 hypothetical protein LEP1GSC047_0944 [Leptospira inadai serovar Lyme str. 10]PNV74119.1 hypothetical protein BES34_015640 [Leptospira inadai serovar Lyme]